MIRTAAVLLAAIVAAAACGGAAQPAPAPTSTAAPILTSAPVPSPTPRPTTTASASPSAAATTAAGAAAFTVATGSKATVRVTEQLADRRDLSDAVLVSEKVSGELTLLPDGTFAPGSRIAVDLTALASDNRQRDNFVKQDTLQTRQFPEATFVPTRTEGLALPLAESGDLAFTLVGRMTVHGVTNEVAFDVKAKRTGADLTATATVTPALRFGTFGMQQPRVFTVLSIKDEIRLEVQLVAKQRT